jgi:hypothetical protein
VAYLTGHSFFPSLISGPFQTGLDIAFDFSIAACLVAAVASLLRGKMYVHDEQSESAVESTADVESATDVALEASALGAGALAVAEVPATARIVIAEELKEPAERMTGSPEPATRTFKER